MTDKIDKQIETIRIGRKALKGAVKTGLSSGSPMFALMLSREMLHQDLLVGLEPEEREEFMAGVRGEILEECHSWVRRYEDDLEAAIPEAEGFIESLVFDIGLRIDELQMSRSKGFWPKSSSEERERSRARLQQLFFPSIYLALHQALFDYEDLEKKVREKHRLLENIFHQLAPFYDVNANDFIHPAVKKFLDPTMFSFEPEEPAEVGEELAVKEKGESE